MVTLDSLIDPASGWTITAANGINDLQQIAATACHLGACYAVRRERPYGVLMRSTAS